MEEGGWGVRIVEVRLTAGLERLMWRRSQWLPRASNPSRRFFFLSEVPCLKPQMMFVFCCAMP